MLKRKTAELLSEGLVSGRGQWFVKVSVLIMASVAFAYANLWNLTAAAGFAIAVSLVVGLGRLSMGQVAEPVRTRLRSGVNTLAVVILLSGTFLPLTLVLLKGTVFAGGIVSTLGALAAVGLGLDAVVLHRPRLAGLLAKLSAVWLGVLALRPHISHIPVHGVTAVVAAVLAVSIWFALGTLRDRPLSRVALWVGFLAGGGAPLVHVVGELL